MTMRSRVALVGLLMAVTAGARAQSPAPPPATVSGTARGTFDVKLLPLDPEKKVEGATLGRMSIDKTFQGDLAGTSRGEMLSALADVKGSGAYVAVEHVTGTLAGRKGSFTLHHRGIMTRGAPDLAVTVVPDSGAGGLAGLTGRMQIDISDGKHHYVFEYTLPAATP